MSSSRVVRGTKGRIILCVCALFIVVAIIACYNNTLSQLEEVRKVGDQCHQQQENLSTQLQVIFDYKQRLEKSLKFEKVEHQQTKKVLETKLEEEHTKYENAANEASTKLSSLQQHYNLLMTQHNDFKEECSKTQQQQLDEINVLQAKLKEVQGQFKKTIIEKENSLEHLKTQYMQIQVDKENLQEKLKDGHNKDADYDSNINHLTKINHQLTRELNTLKEKCSTLVKADHITVGSQNQLIPPTNNSNNLNDNAKQPEDKQEPANVVDLPSNVDEEHPIANEQLVPPKTEKIVEVNNANVLPPPNSANVLPSIQKTSTSTKINLEVVQPLHIPAVTVNNNINSKPSEEAQVQLQDQHVLPVPHGINKVPEGVVPAPETHLETHNKDIIKHNGDEKGIREDVNNAFPNRYRNNLIINEMANEAKAKEADKREENKEKPFKIDAGDADNAAVEEVDPPINNIDPFALDDSHDPNKANVKRFQQKVRKQHINDEKLGKQGHKLYDGADGIDYDKDIQNGVPVEENDPEAEDDDPDYADPIARQKDIAVRN